MSLHSTGYVCNAVCLAPHDAAVRAAWRGQVSSTMVSKGGREASAAGSMSAHHPAVAPEAAWVGKADARPGRVGQQPDLRRCRVHAIP